MRRVQVGAGAAGGELTQEWYCARLDRCMLCGLPASPYHQLPRCRNCLDPSSLAPCLRPVPTVARMTRRQSQGVGGRVSAALPARRKDARGWQEAAEAAAAEGGALEVRERGAGRQLPSHRSGASAEAAAASGAGRRPRTQIDDALLLFNSSSERVSCASLGFEWGRQVRVHLRCTVCAVPPCCRG